MAEETTNQPSNIRQEYNLARIGLNMDQSVNQIQKGQLTYALNAQVDNFDGSSLNYQNEPGNVFCMNFPTNYYLIGEHAIQEKNKHVFFLVHPETGDSEIGYMDNNDCVYHTYINAKCLNFSVNHPIHKAVHKISNCTTEIYWTDGLNPRRYLDLNPENAPWLVTYTNDSVCEPIVHVGTVDCNKLNIQPNFSIPELEVTEVINGGDLKAGTYQFAIQYCSANGDAYTSYYSVTNPTPIANPQLTTPNFDYAVGKSIILNISNLDLTGYFQYYNVAVIKTINGAAAVELVGTYFIDGSAKKITYTGQAKTGITLSTADILEKYPYYDIAEDITSVQDILIWDGLTSIDRLSYQQIANGITLGWETWRIPSTETYADPVNATNLRGYLRDEIYAFEIVFLLKNGKQTDGFHIPGRIATSSDLTPVNKATNADFIGSGTTAPYWKIYNTASTIDFAPEYIAAADKYSTYKGPYQYGEFAYWESTELYPCNTAVWGDLADTPIRHHKFPDVLVSPIFETPNIITVNGKYAPVMQNDAIFPIGVRIDSEQVSQLIAHSSLSQSQKDEIVGYKIVRGDRSTNKSIVAKGILRNVGQYEREGTKYLYPNYPYNDLHTDPFLLVNNNAYNSQCSTYSVTVSVAGVLQYTDCYTNLTTNKNVIPGYQQVCSITKPMMLSGTAIIINNSSYSFTLFSYKQGTTQVTTFSYTRPDTGITIEVEVSANLPVTIDSSTVPVYVSGSTNYVILDNTNGKNPNCYPANLQGFDFDSQYRQVFNSPETSFGQPTLGGILKLESAIFGAGKAHFVEVKNHALYKLLTKQAQVDALNSSYTIANLGGFDATAMFTAYQAYLQIYIASVTGVNLTYSFNSIASYDYSADVPNGQGIKQRELDICQYLIPGVQSVGDSYNVNNYQRESSVYTKTSKLLQPLPFASSTPSLIGGIGAGNSLIVDNSRFTVSEKGNCVNPGNQEDISVVAYYGSIKNNIVNQWGQMYSYNTIDTGFQRKLGTTTVETIFGGDTFIGRFAFKTKLPFFIDNRVNAPDGSDIFYDEIGNIAYPQYWYSARSVLSDYTAGTTVMKNIISVKAHFLDCPNDVVPPVNTTTSTTTTSKDGTVTLSTTNPIYNGKMYLFAYGIPSYYVESSINVDLRQAFNNLEGDFYPHVSTGIPDNWLQQSVVPIQFDNTYTYNVTYSRQNTENYFNHLPVDWTSDKCFTRYPFRAIYSEAQANNPNVKVNSWLNYSPLAYFDFPQNYGKLTSLDGIQNKAILARFENKSLLYNTMLTMQTSNPQAAYLGNPTLFRSAPPVDFAETDLGFMGSQNKFLLKIPQGQITADAKRGQIFLISGIAGQVTDLSGFGNGMNRFFTDHLAFEILNHFPDADTDNHFKGIGLHGVYDSKYDRIIVTKLDYIPQLDKRGQIFYDAANNEYYINKQYGDLTLRQVVQLTDEEYFCNKSWTLSLDTDTKTWISFHSYLPNFYIGENNYFYSGLNQGCDIEAIAATIIPSPTTTTTTTAAPLYCNLSGDAVYVPDPCEMEANAVCEDCTTTTTSTTSTTTTFNPYTTTTTTTIYDPVVAVYSRCIDGFIGYIETSTANAANAKDGGNNCYEKIDEGILSAMNIAYPGMTYVGTLVNSSCHCV